MATRCCSFEVHAQDGSARAGLLHLPHGEVQTPAFMPVGTRGTVRGLSPSDLTEAGSQMVLSNTYHLWVRPGHRLIQEAGGLHAFMGWSGPLLTDSGGYQVFSLKEHTKVTEDGVRFRSPEDGLYRLLTPEVAVEIQEALGVDVAMAFDECLEWPATPERTAASTARTTRWLLRCLEARQRPQSTALFGIVQGGTWPEQRQAHAEQLAQLDLDGYAIGGLSVGEGAAERTAMAALAARSLPVDRVRYLMGVGQPIDIAQAVQVGVDLFDCVLPSRAGRHGLAYTWEGKRNLKNGRYKTDLLPLDPSCPCAACRTSTRAYLSHLVRADEMLGKRWLTLHNLTFYQQLMAKLRQAVVGGPDAPAFSAVVEAAGRASAPAPADRP